MKLKIKKLNLEAIIPAYQTKEAAGFDLHSIEDVVIKPNERKLISTGLAFEIEFGYEVQIRPRSGLAAKHGVTVLNTPGTIDSDYRGEIKIILFNHGDKEFIINNKDRIAQMILTPVHKMSLEEVDNLPDSVRGRGGFGSTGK